MKTKRILAYVIDVIFITLIIAPLLLLAFLSKLYYLSPALFTLYIFLMITRDMYNKNQSIGKKKMKIKILTLNNTIPSYNVLIFRNVLFIILYGIDLLLILIINKTIGDIIFKTKLVYDY